MRDLRAAKVKQKSVFASEVSVGQLPTYALTAGLISTIRKMHHNIILNIESALRGTFQWATLNSYKSL
ncbi:hypothetical protein [Runella sp. SP2]|uniref:hypothetical protein n=1 Tax=Runella sp. SP2 TaxID=2268026 RepID=UPI000F07B787|nr:hypothetical protein [Runella sp. SP2]AYQ31340.1 hypothetical protein DTQ70_03740 [Runella sp. SP2]